MTKTYAYTTYVDFDFDILREDNHLHAHSSLDDIRHAVHEYATEMDDAEYYCIDNEEQIAHDLQEYLQNYDVSTAIGIDEDELQEIFERLWQQYGDEYGEDDEEDYCHDCICQDDRFYDIEDEEIQDYLTKRLVKYFNAKLKNN